MAIGVVANANPVYVMPWRLARAFQRSQAWDIESNVYPNGERQARALTTTSRKSWALEVGLIAAHLEDLRDFYQDRDGGLEPFWFYDVYETVPLFSYDSGGDAATGKHTVRFEGAWEQTVGVGVLRGSVPLQLVELA